MQSKTFWSWRGYGVKKIRLCPPLLNTKPSTIINPFRTWHEVRYHLTPGPKENRRILLESTSGLFHVWTRGNRTVKFFSPNPILIRKN